MPKTLSRSSIAIETLAMKLNIASTVEVFFLKTNLFFEEHFIINKKALMRFRISFSEIFKKIDNLKFYPLILP